MGTPLYTNIPSVVGELLIDVKNGKIGLPDLQRPFVWLDNKVRDLLDSMYKGFPIGYIMLWAAPDDYERTSQIGVGIKKYDTPQDLVIDGQQRLTALLAAMYGIEVKDKNYKSRRIRISFNPIKKDFKVWTSATEKDPEYIDAISDVFAANAIHANSKFRRDYIQRVNESRQKNNLSELTDAEKDHIEDSINDLLNLESYSLPTLKISSKADEEDVSEIFVRVNSGGQKLTEKNFIETLLAVFDNEVHDKINKFCEESRKPVQGTSYNQIIEVDPSHLIRICVGLCFQRARLKYAYMMLRGKDLKTGIVSLKTREVNLEKFRKALEIATNLNNWHAFLNLYADAGYYNQSMISSSNAVVFSYILYLLGKYEYKVSSLDLQKVMTKWIFMSTVTSFYSNSTETNVEKQMADLKDVHTAFEFIEYLNKSIDVIFTNDYFTYSLITDLSTSSTNSPVWNGYLAAINILGTPMLFSSTPALKYMLPGANGTKNSIDKHHIFPKHYLEEIGFKNDRDRNQIANFTYLDYQTNIDIADKPPFEYVNEYRKKLGEDAYMKTCEDNALPVDFEKMEYLEFINERKKLMAGIIHKAYFKLCK